MSLLPLQITSALAAGPAVLKTATSAVSTATSAFGSMLKQAVAAGTSDTGDKNSNAPGTLADAAALLQASRNANRANTLPVRTRLAEQFEQFRMQLMQILDENGVDTTKGFTLELDDKKQLKVVGDHPDKSAIEMLLASRPEFAEAFGQLGALHTALDKLEKGTSGQPDGTALSSSAGLAAGAPSPAANAPDDIVGQATQPFRLHLDRMRAQPVAA